MRTVNVAADEAAVRLQRSCSCCFLKMIKRQLCDISMKYAIDAKRLSPKRFPVSHCFFFFLLLTFKSKWNSPEVNHLIEPRGHLHYLAAAEPPQHNLVQYIYIVITWLHDLFFGGQIKFYCLFAYFLHGSFCDVNPVFQTLGDSKMHLRWCQELQIKVELKAWMWF